MKGLEWRTERQVGQFSDLQTPIISPFESQGLRV
jgi:hypothetical protein